MEPNRTSPDDLDVRLSWPGEDGPKTSPPAGTAAPLGRLLSVHTEEPFAPARAQDRPPRWTEAGTIPAATLDAHPSLSSLAVRLDALASAVGLLRSLLADRIADFGEQVVRVQAAADRDLKDYRRLHDRALESLESRLSEAEAATARIERASLAMAADLASMKEATQSLVHRPDPPLVDLEPVSRELGELKASLGRMDTGREAEPGLASAVERLSEGLADLDRRVESRLEQLDRELASRVDQLDRRLAERLDETRPAGNSEESPLLAEVFEQLAGLAAQTEALRRRMTLKARNVATLDAETLGAIAEVVAARLNAGSAAPPTGPPDRSRSRRA